MKTFEEPMTPRLKTQKLKTTKNWTAGTQDPIKYHTQRSLTLRPYHLTPQKRIKGPGKWRFN